MHQQYQTTLELAVMCDVMTGGVVAPDADLFTKAIFIRAAFSHYNRAAVLAHDSEATNYKDLFVPAPFIKSLMLLGGQRKHGVQRWVI